MVIEAAHARGLKLTGHVPLKVSPLQACELGMDGIEHVGSLLEAYKSVAQTTNEQAFAYFDSDEALPLYRCLAERGVEVTPTLVFYRAVARSRTSLPTLSRDALKFMRDMQRIARRMHDAGVSLLTGSDTAWMSEPKAPQVQVLISATFRSAAALGVEAKTGSIAVGKAADFVLLEADPGVDVANVRKLRAVYIAGARVD